MIDLHDRIVGSMVGGAVGDALGYPVEFIFSFDGIRAKYGARGICEFDTNSPWFVQHGEKGAAQFSDDTQMTLYTAEGLLYALSHNTPVIPTISDAYLHWLGPQTGKKFGGRYPSALVAIEEINQRRAPGNTCIDSLRAIVAGHKPSNNSKGCGGIMRIAPIALYSACHGLPLEQIAKLAGEVAEITHLHQLSTLSSACCAAIIAQCATAEGSITVDDFSNIVSTSLECVAAVYPDSPCLDMFRNLVAKAICLRCSPLADWMLIEIELGEGWVAEETLAIALFSVARHIGSFEECVVCAVNHGGDSDSTGAVAGNIIGAILGRKAIPAKFTDMLQRLDLIESIARDLCR